MGGGHPAAHWQLPIILLSSVVEDVSCTSVVSRDETIRISRAEGCGQPGEAKIVIVTYRLYVTINIAFMCQRVWQEAQLSPRDSAMRRVS